MAYGLIEPFGQDRADDGSRLVAAMIYNSNRGKDTKAAMPEDFLKTWRPPEVIDEAERMARAAAWFEARAVPAA